MQPKPQEVPGYFVWQAPGKPFAVHLSLDVVDRLSNDIQRGFGAVPKRGAEVGGVLFGRIEAGESTIVRVDDFEAVACEYGRGPSYYLSSEEQETFGKAASSERDGSLRPVGYYRSHTRDGAASLGPEDLDLMGRYFPDADQVALLVKPFATKVSLAGFLVREDGVFPAETPLEFPFRRREMTGEAPPARRSMTERRPRVREQSSEPRGGPAEAPEYDSRSDYAPTYAPELPVYLDEFAEPPPKRRPVWMWFPLVLILAGLIAALGYQAALTFAPRLHGGVSPEAFALDLSVTRGGESLTVRWNRDSPAVQAAERGALEIEDGEFVKSVPLDPEHLKEGTVIYQNSSPSVKFRLVVFLTGKTSIAEVVDWAQ